MIATLLLLLSFVIQAPPAAAEVRFEDLPKVQYWRDPYYISEGYRLGFIVDFTLDYKLSSLFPWYSSYEGLMMVGYGSDKEDIVDPYCMRDADVWLKNIKDPDKRRKATERVRNDCYIFTNPWTFSTLDTDIYSKYSNITNSQLTPVLLYYTTPWVSTEHAWITKTKNFVEGIFPVNEDLPIEQSYKVPTSEMPIASKLNSQEGFVDGRIVKASLDHWLRKSFEITIQEGASGNNFRAMSVSSQGMFNFIVKAMLAGKLVRVYYLEITGLESDLLAIGKNYDTPFRVTGLEIRKESSSTGLPAPTAPPQR